MFQFLNHGFSMQEINKFINYLGTEISLFIKQCPLKFMSANTWWLTKDGARLLSDLVAF